MPKDPIAQKLFDLIKQTDTKGIVRIEGVPYEVKFQFDGLAPAVTGDPDNEVICCAWVDEFPRNFYTKFTERGLASAQVNGNKIALEDYEGNETVLELYDLTPVSIILTLNNPT